MFMESEDETRDFVTVYGKEFQGKSIERIEEYRPLPNYLPPLNVLNGPYEQRLYTHRKNASLPLNERSEDPQEYLNKIREKYPRLIKILPEHVPDENLIEQKEKEITKSVYQLSYSKDIDDYSPRVKIPGKIKGAVTLPSDWIIPETIQRKSYRNPWKIATEKLLRVKRIEKPFDNLSPNPKEREILRIRTGDSEYNGTIDVTGNRIMQSLSTELFQQDSKEPDSPGSECSEILAAEKLVLPSNIF